ncbi:hypothetical protein C8Q80DRAFT_1205149 [Daedaleopsis nitida]|nr:hypothetical protein C8Q80DRAFT_1205149 [Daedaleopsis nitida]
MDGQGQKTATSTAVTPTPPSRIHTASAPFSKTYADIILRTSDNVDFYVWKGILIESSPVLADMFLLGDKLAEKESSTSVVDVLESSAVLDPLLRICYPPPHPRLSSLEDLKPVIAAAHKYQMDGVLEVLKEQLSKHAQTVPLRAYVFALSLDMQDAAGSAARHFLNHHPHDEYVPDLEGFNAGSYHRLLAYRKQCTEALANMIASQLSWLQDGAWQPFLTCGCASVSFQVTLRESDAARQPKVWFWQHYLRMGALLAERPCRAAIEDPALIDRAIREASGCANCRNLVHEGLHAFMTQFKDEIERRIEAVPLPLQ